MDVVLKYRTDLRITIYSTQGQIVASEAYQRSAGLFRREWSTENWAAGSYLIELDTDYGRFLKRLVITD